MKLFVSYSHDDKAYVKTLADALNDEDSQHDVWMDRKLFGGTEWWRAIINQIEECECFICILTPLSISSIYCSAELKYAVDLNKPILPLKLKNCDIPEMIRHIQFIDISDLPQERILRRCERALGELRAKTLKGEFRTPVVIPNRPPMPEHAIEIEKNKTLELSINIESEMLGMNDHTHRIYHRWIRRFLSESADEFLEINSLEDISVAGLREILRPDIFKEWLSLLVEANNGRDSVGQARASVLWLAHLLFERGLVDETLVALLKHISTPTAPIKTTREKLWLNPTQMRNLVQSSQVGRNPQMTIRNNAIVRLMVTLGLNRDEIATLTWDDILCDSSDNRLQIRINKNGKYRFIPLPQATCDALIEWRNCHPNPLNDTPVFTRIFKGDQVTAQGITDRAIWLIIRNAAKNIGLEKISPDVIRRSFARNAYDVGVSIDVIMEVLGHTDLRSTIKYIFSTKPAKVSIDVWANTLDEEG